jgi:predicted nucleic acid-binding protein
VSGVFWDSNLFIYLVENVAPYVTQVELLVQHMRQKRLPLITSALTVCETLVKPTREQRTDLILHYQHLFDRIPLISIDASIAPLFAEVRSQRQIKGPDALQLACALRAGASIFLTNDERLSTFSHPALKTYSLSTYLAAIKLAE